MPRGVIAFGATREQAESAVRAEAPGHRILRSSEVSLNGLPIPPEFTGERIWAVVVEHADPATEAELEQHQDPEATVAAEVRRQLVGLAVAPEALSAGTTETFTCPNCRGQARAKLPPKHQAKPFEHAQCNGCGSRFDRHAGGSVWRARAKQDHACLFCDGRADSQEHLIPAWIGRRLGVKEFSPGRRCVRPGRACPSHSADIDGQLPRQDRLRPVQPSLRPPRRGSSATVASNGAGTEFVS